MEQQTIIIIFGMSLVTYLPRALPLMVLSRMDIPRWFLQWLKYIPAAVISALLVPGIIMVQGRPDFSFANKNLIAAVPCILVAYKTKNLFITVLTGIASMLFLNFIMG